MTYSPAIAAASRLTGVINHIAVDSVDAIDVDGINNVITYQSGTPKITKSGGQNTVHKG